MSFPPTPNCHHYVVLVMSTDDNNNNNNNNNSSSQWHHHGPAPKTGSKRGAAIVSRNCQSAKYEKYDVVYGEGEDSCAHITSPFYHWKRFHHLQIPLIFSVDASSSGWQQQTTKRRRRRRRRKRRRRKVSGDSNSFLMSLTLQSIPSNDAIKSLCSFKSIWFAVWKINK